MRLASILLLLLTAACGPGGPDAAADPPDAAADPPAAAASPAADGESQPAAPAAGEVSPPAEAELSDSSPEPAAAASGGGDGEAEPQAASGEVTLGADGRKHAGTLADPVPIDIDFLGAWTFEEKDQPFPQHVLDLDGKFVRITGFMLPDIDFENIKSFHLIRSLWGCCFGAPPRINEIVRVTISKGDGLDYTYNAVEAIGRLDVIYEVEDGIVEDLYRLEAASVEEIEFDDPEAPANFDPETDLEGYLPG